MHPDDEATIAALGQALLEMGVPLPRRNAALTEAWIAAFAGRIWMEERIGRRPLEEDAGTGAAEPLRRAG